MHKSPGYRDGEGSHVTWATVSAYPTEAITYLNEEDRARLRRAIGSDVVAIYIKWIGPKDWPVMFNTESRQNLKEGTIYPELIALRVLHECQLRGWLKFIHYEYL